MIPRIATVQASDRYLAGRSSKDLRAADRDPLHGYATFLKHGVIGQGLNDYDRSLGRLARAGYDGWVSIEDGEGPTIDVGMDNLRRSVEFLRARFAQHFGEARA